VSAETKRSDLSIIDVHLSTLKDILFTSIEKQTNKKDETLT